MARSNEPIELELEIHFRTTKAILVSELGEEKDEGVWIPLSQVTFITGDEDDDTVIVTVPEWLALDKGLI